MSDINYLSAMGGMMAGTFLAPMLGEIVRPTKPLHEIMAMIGQADYHLQQAVELYSKAAKELERTERKPRGAREKKGRKRVKGKA